MYISSFILSIPEEKKSDFDLANVIEVSKDRAILPYLYLQPIGTSLCDNDTTYIADHRSQFDSIVQAPYLRQPMLKLYQDKVNYLKAPQAISHYMLYGDNADEATAREKMPFMIPVYNLLEKYAGKVIYVDFWGVTCPPLSGGNGAFEGTAETLFAR